MSKGSSEKLSSHVSVVLTTGLVSMLKQLPHSERGSPSTQAIWHCAVQYRHILDGNTKKFSYSELALYNLFVFTTLRWRRLGSCLPSLPV